MSKLKRMLHASLAACLVTLLFWVGGFDFDKRGMDAVGWLYLTLCAFFGVYFWRSSE